MKMVEDSKTPAAVKAVTKLSGVKLVPLLEPQEGSDIPSPEQDDIEAYLVTFEHIVQSHKIDEGRWHTTWHLS